MRKSILITLIFIFTNCVKNIKAQVGVNTEFPKATLDIAASPNDLLKIDGIIAPKLTGNELKLKDSLYGIDQNGTIIYATAAANPATSKTIYVTSAGYYYFDSASMKWLKLAVQKNDYQLAEVLIDVANSPVDVSAGTSDSNDLGLSLNVIIPANSSVKILVDYSVPMGTTPVGNNTTAGGYYGIRFLKNGVEEQIGSRKFSVPSTYNNVSKMVSVAGKFTEEITNPTGSDITVNYTLNGYVEATTSTIRFNMWAAAGNNFNWGKGSLTITSFVKQN